jgi:hypothetical protein
MTTHPGAISSSISCSISRLVRCSAIGFSLGSGLEMSRYFKHSFVFHLEPRPPSSTTDACSICANQQSPFTSNGDSRATTGKASNPVDPAGVSCRGNGMIQILMRASNSQFFFSSYRAPSNAVDLLNGIGAGSNPAPSWPAHSPQTGCAHGYPDCTNSESRNLKQQLSGRYGKVTGAHQKH